MVFLPPPSMYSGEPLSGEDSRMISIEKMKEINPTIYNACKIEEMVVLKSICDIQEYDIVFVKKDNKKEQ